ncbi:hypothetical protein ANN_04628 [Periplaneta americana]|uniref:Uncharacterized protein n=1 Tax=Periplaneta americana TaxID=6978 RepID=A0ABQ8TBC3_PERAM|nr:hypothetical protein ANN_04628 [Periplaneta americana]
MNLRSKSHFIYDLHADMFKMSFRNSNYYRQLYSYQRAFNWIETIGLDQPSAEMSSRCLLLNDDAGAGKEWTHPPPNQPFAASWSKASSLESRYGIHVGSSPHGEHISHEILANLWNQCESSIVMNLGSLRYYRKIIHPRLFQLSNFEVATAEKSISQRQKTVQSAVRSQVWKHRLGVFSCYEDGCPRSSERLTNLLINCCCQVARKSSLAAQLDAPGLQNG